MIHQSPWGAGRLQAPVTGGAGVVMVEKFEFTLNKNLAAGDIIELGVLPAFATVVDATLIADSLGASVTMDVGLMSKEVGSTDVSRTSGNELFATAAAGVVRMSAASGFKIAPTEGDRSVGVKASAAVTATGQKLMLVMYYKQ